jgi:hypothetical protein
LITELLFAALSILFTISSERRFASGGALLLELYAGFVGGAGPEGELPCEAFGDDPGPGAAGPG